MRNINTIKNLNNTYKMTIEEILKFCTVCKNRKIDLEKG